MTDEMTVQVDRKLHGFTRFTLSYLGVVGGVILVLWLVGLFTGGSDAGERDLSWWASGAVRLVSFAVFAVLSFLATLGAQPDDPKTEEASPGRRQVRLRVVSAVFALLFFGDLAASSFADTSLGWVATARVVPLGLCALFAVAAFAVGRTILRLWEDAGEGFTPAWKEPSEMAANREVSSVGVHVLYLAAFLAAWVLGDELPTLLGGAGGEGHAGEAFVTLEGVALAVVGGLQLWKRELFMQGRLDPTRRRNVDVVMSMIGVALCAELGARLIVGIETIQPLGFWITAVLCFLGVLGGGAVMARVAASSPSRS